VTESDADKLAALAKLDEMAARARAARDIYRKAGATADAERMEEALTDVVELKASWERRAALDWPELWLEILKQVRTELLAERERRRGEDERSKLKDEAELVGAAADGLRDILDIDLAALEAAGDDPRKIAERRARFDAAVSEWQEKFPGAIGIVKKFLEEQGPTP
jgi:hypothetical protein